MTASIRIAQSSINGMTSLESPAVVSRARLLGLGLTCPSPRSAKACEEDLPPVREEGQVIFASPRLRKRGRSELLAETPGSGAAPQTFPRLPC